MNYLLVEPINKSPYPPLGLLKISTYLKKKYRNSNIIPYYSSDFTPISTEEINEIYVTTLFTWETKQVQKAVIEMNKVFPKAKINIGGIAATIAPNEFNYLPNTDVCIGLHPEAENLPPDYSLNFGRDRLQTSITSITRGCVNNCKFCFVPTMEGRKLIVRDSWENDINPDYKMITFWDNNFLAIDDLGKMVDKIAKYEKKVDFNQGLDAFYFTEDKAKLLSKLNLDCVRFALDTSAKKKYVERAIKFAKEHIGKEIRVYVLYGYNDSPEDLYERINLLNELGVCSYPMRYRSNLATTSQPSCKDWSKEELRGFNLSLYFFYRKGMISTNQDTFSKVYGKNSKEFKAKLYNIYEYDKGLRYRSV